MVAFGDRGGGNSTVGVFGTINRCLWSWASVNSRDHYPYRWQFHLLTRLLGSSTIDRL